MLFIFNVLFSTILGAIIGKFMAMTAYYLPEILFEGCDKGREPRDIINWFFQKPHCCHCQHPFNRKENAPIFGYLFLKGVCPYCHQPIGKKVFLLEFGMALFFGISAIFFPLGLPLLFFWIVSAILILCFITDYEHGILPDQFTLGLVWIGLIGSLRPIFLNSEEAILGAIAGYGFFWSFNVIYRFFRGFDGMYPGDFKLNAGIGSIVGVKLLFPVILISLLSLVVITVIQVIRTKGATAANVKLLYKEIPYACFASVVTLSILVLMLFEIVVPSPFYSSA